MVSIYSPVPLHVKVLLISGLFKIEESFFLKKKSKNIGIVITVQCQVLEFYK